MDILTAGFLIVAGFAGGVITTMVGGASLVAFPAMLAIGLPPIVASASVATAISPGGVIAVIDDRRHLPRWDRHMARLTIVSLVFSAAGAVLVLALPERSFTLAVPALIGFATILFAFADPIRRRVMRLIGATAPRPAGQVSPWLLAPIALYGGYFGAAMSVMVLALLAASSRDDFRVLNVLKNYIGALCSVLSIAIYAHQGVIAWAPVFVMMIGAFFGGWSGGRLARILPRDVMRGLVIAVGVLMTGVFAWRYWWLAQ